MKNLFIAGNWKSYKSGEESVDWIKKQTLASVVGPDKKESVTVVVCAPFTSLPQMHYFLTQNTYPFVLGAQDISPYPEGAYTGEVSGRMLADLVAWVIVGHSERRKYFAETDDVLAVKVSQAKSNGLKVIYCVPDDKTKVPEGIDVVAYEPVWAIGTGKTDTPQNAGNVIASIKKQTGVPTVIYGGSVKPDNVSAFVTVPEIDGVLPGGASLDPQSFTQLVGSAIASLQ